jgi:HPr kinase/phosphorylase
MQSFAPCRAPSTPNLTRGSQKALTPGYFLIALSGRDCFCVETSANITNPNGVAHLFIYRAIVEKSSPENFEVSADITQDISVSVTIREFMTDPSLDLNLEVLRGHAFLENVIRSPRVQKLGMALVGTSGGVHPDRLQIMSTAESNYLNSLDDDEQLRAIRRLKKYKICCIVITQGMDVPEALLQLAEEQGIPVIRSGSPSDISVARISRYLEQRLAPRMTIHGGLLEVFGLGVIILGPSGIGKSECALELVLKGHRLIADDYIEITRHGIDRLMGEGGKVLKHHMELRGLGIIDIRELFGISATGTTQVIDFIVRLERWKADGEYDRLGMEHSSMDFLGVSIPVIDMPVAPGRNVATLVEVAARIHLLRQRGYKTNGIIDN